MAPPNRRPGYSRRAQYTTFFGYIAGILGALLGGALLIVSIFGPTTFSGLRMLGSDATAPVAGLGAKGRSGSYSLIENIGGYFHAASQNAKLKRELDTAKVRLIEAQAQAEENRRLKALLRLSESDARPVAFARLIGSTSSSTRRFATLSAGARDGVAMGMPVRSPLGLVGRVLEVGNATSRVLLITDTESVVPVRRARDSVAAFAQGRSDGRLQVRLINLGINPLKPGDALVTSGSGGLFWPGTPIAIVTSLTRDGAIAQLISDPAAAEYVAIQQIWAPESVLPAATPSAASPAPAPAPAVPGPQ